MTRPRDCDALCVCGSVRFVDKSDLARKVALREPGELRWFLWDGRKGPGLGFAVLDEAGRVKLVAQARAARWTTVELIPWEVNHGT
jgi:hypothetical protein